MQCLGKSTKAADGAGAGVDSFFPRNQAFSSFPLIRFFHSSLQLQFPLEAFKLKDRNEEQVTDRRWVISSPFSSFCT